MMIGKLESARDIHRAVQEIGFLPLFRGAVPGLSVEEHTPSELWFREGVDGPWEWKGEVLRMGGCLYGKFFSGKAGWVSETWFPDFANVRRNGYDYEGFFSDGFSPEKDREIYEAVQSAGEIGTKELKRACGYTGGGKKGFDTVIARLQAQTFVTVSDFVYSVDRYAKPYGWGIARYITPEYGFGEAFLEEAYEREPLESYERIVTYLQGILPGVDMETLKRFLGKEPLHTY